MIFLKIDTYQQLTKFSLINKKGNNIMPGNLSFIRKDDSNLGNLSQNEEPNRLSTTSATTSAITVHFSDEFLLGKLLEQQGGGGGGGNMEARIAKLEAHVEHIQSDVSEIKTDLKQIRVDMKADFANVNNKIDSLRNETRKDFKWIVGIMLTSAVAIGIGLLKNFIIK
jgi:outer membrane murein-binding lipoprotein Lpp